MPKVKTRSAAKKRFKKVGGNRKIKRAKAHRRHILTKKSSKTKRKLRKRAYIDKADMSSIKKMITY